MPRTYDGGETRYGFRWGPLTVERCASDDWGVAIYLRTPRQNVLVRVTPSGLIRVGALEPARRPTAVKMEGTDASE